MTSKTSAEVRDDLIRAFRMDMFGPETRPDFHNAHMANTETIVETRPSSFYLTGYLAPFDGSAMARPRDDDAALQSALPGMDDDDEAGTANGDDGNGGRATRQRKRLMPSNLGLTAFVLPDCPHIDVRLRYADYIASPPVPDNILEGNSTASAQVETWTRAPKFVEHRLTAADLAKAANTLGGMDIPLSETASPQRRGGVVHLHVIVQYVDMPRPDGTLSGLSVTVFVVNRRAASNRFRDVSYIFQAGLELEAGGKGFIGNPDVSGHDSDDFDLRLHDLHYRDVLRFVGGRNIGTGHGDKDGDFARRIWSDPFPSADVEKVSPNNDLNAISTFNMQSLAQLTDNPDALVADLLRFPNDYANFIAQQTGDVAKLDTSRRQDVARRLVDDQKAAQARMASGIKRLANDPNARLAFKAMNLAIHDYLATRVPDPNKIQWRPFQLAFILLNLDGLCEKTHEDRKIVDLLFFPTGGGKTEAYLGLAAFQIAYRRLNNPDWMGGGVSVIMRYTLRLLTLDQLGRAAAMICALELLRRSQEWQDAQGQPLLGLGPIEIGLWVGSGATPNYIGGKGINDSRRKHAHTKVKDFRRSGKDAPAPIKNCPWCNTPFGTDTFHVEGSRMLISCENISCDFSAAKGGLPILAVDEEIYNRLPAFIVGTVDKFASLPRRGAVGRIFDHVDRMDAQSGTEQMQFYGADTPGKGMLIDGDTRACLPPPDLIIQDELHLISGPLGTIAGLYEAAVERLASRRINGELRGPKIVASTATVRRAEDQIFNLFGRDKTSIFPPPGIDRRFSYFAVTKPLNEAEGRRYIGVSALGIGPRKVFLRSIVPILAAAKKAFDEDARDGKENAADPYMTALCYFNALRELGASRRIVEDEVASNLAAWPRKRLKDGELITNSPFVTRTISGPVELTSRLSTDLVSLAKRRLDISFSKQKSKSDESLDVALATNMISVGLDIERLGLMFVQNQPKSAAEYIQATSRVGRDQERPGLVLVVLNMHRARDRAHYEDFETYHEAFYRSVEATSVTPTSKRAKDRTLGAVFAGLVRHLEPSLTPQGGAASMDRSASGVQEAIDFLSSRLCDRDEIERLLEAWEQLISNRAGEKFHWDTHDASDDGLMHDPLVKLIPPSDEFELFRAGWSMRDVQPGVALDIDDFLRRARKQEPVTATGDE